MCLTYGADGPQARMAGVRLNLTYGVCLQEWGDTIATTSLWGGVSVKV